jgi:DNA-binding transcriptional LysR family regulator
VSDETRQPKSAADRISRIDWDDLRYAAMVAEAGGIKTAARLLHVTPAHVSRRVEQLEGRLGAKLFHREKSGMKLTQVGEEIIDGIQTMKRVADRIETSAIMRDRKPQGRVKVTVADGLGGYAIAPHMADFLDKHPDIQLELDCGYWSHKPLRNPTELRFDFDRAPVSLDEAWISMGTLHYLLFASKDYIEKYGMPKTMASIADHRYLDHVAQVHQQEQWGAREAALKTLSIASFVTNSSTALLHAVEGGAGIGAFPSYIAQHCPELVIVRDVPVATIQMGLVHHRDAPKTARIAAVIDWLRTLVDPRSHPWFRDEFIHPDEFAPLAQRAGRDR